MSRNATVLALLGVALLIAAVVSLVVGSASISFAAVLRALLPHASEQMATTIVWDIRLPRTLLAILVGGGIAAAGAAIQGLFRNPLADPALIGVSSGAALFAAGFMVLGIHSGFIATLGVSGSAFIGGLAATLLVLETGRRGGTISSMLLAGVAINSMAIAGVGLFAYIATDLELRSVSFWALGSFNGASWQGVAVALVIPLMVVLLLTESRNLNAITLGDREAEHLGISVTALRWRVVVYTALAVGIGVSLTGVIAFVGLVVPHLVRLTTSSNHQVVIPGSALLGAVLMLLADTLSRSVVSPAELPIGIVTALLGGPFFIYLIIKQKGRLGI
ncbi:MAG TPA: iron chelate uptake ABC transporter family permease subunit [Pseudomonadales bacterium]|nr:iron chelate uptake ABC transporter family permease subunit [Pseudomonadales bacterium]